MDEWLHYVRGGWMDLEHSVLAWDVEQRMVVRA
jgi:hypothetical protein